MVDFAFMDSVGKAEEFLACGGDINARDGAGETPLIYAVCAFRYDVAKFLILRGADVNACDACGMTALHYAGGNLDLAETLVAHDADKNARSDDGITPLDFAVQLGEKSFAEFLYSQN